MLVKKIIVDQVYLENFVRTEYNSQTEVDIPYLAGSFKNMIPKELQSTGRVEFIDRQYVNDSFLFNETIDIGPKGLYYIILHKAYKIENMIFIPNDINADIFVHKDSRLIYSFYNPTNRKTIVAKGSISEDYDKIGQRLKSNLTDIYYRNYFIKLALENKPGDPKIPEFFPEIMNSDQLAVYLGVAEKTIRSWTSQKEIPFTKLKQAVRYRKKNIDKWLDSRTISK